MSRILAYGSLMSAAERKPLGIRRLHAYPVMVSGFRRSFSQEPSWRRGVGNHRGVLTVYPDDQASMNAVLVTDVPGAALAVLDERERGYDRVLVRSERIRPFGDAKPGVEPSDAFIYVGKPHQLDPELQPNVDYLRLCVQAAGEWGEAFLEAFQRTTFVSDAPLAEVSEAAPSRTDRSEGLEEEKPRWPESLRS